MYGKMFFIFKAVILHPIKAIIKIDEELRQARIQQHKELEHKPTASVEMLEEEDRSFKGKEALYGNFVGSAPKIQINGARLSEMNQRNAILLHTILDEGNAKYNKKQEETEKKVDKQIFVAKPVEEIAAVRESKNDLSQVPLPILEIPPMSTYGSLPVGKELQLGAETVQEEDAKKLHAADLKEFQNQATQTFAISSNTGTKDLEFSADDYDTQNLTSSRSCNNDHTTTSELHNETKLERYTSNIDMPPEPEILYGCDEMNPITSAASSYHTCLSSFGEENLQDPLTTLKNFKTTEKGMDIGEIALASTGQNKDDDKKHEHKDTEQKKSKNSHIYEKYADQFQEDNLNTHKLKDFEQQKRNSHVKPVTDNTKLSTATSLPQTDTTDALSKSKSLRLWKMQQLINIFENPSGVVGMDKSFKDTELNTFITKRSSDIKEFIAKFELKEKLNSVKQELSEMFGNEQK